MFDSIRKHQRVLQFILLLLIFPAFVFFGVSGYDSFLSDEGSVAKVDGLKVTRQEFDQAQRRQLDQLRQMLGDQVDAKLLDTPEARKEVIDGLIAQKVLQLAAAGRHLVVSDAKLRSTILEIPGLKKPDGSFDMERYQTLLKAQGMTEAMFEGQLRRDLLLQILPDAASQSTFVPKTVVSRMIALQEETREVREQLIKATDFVDKVKISDDAVKQYYDTNAKEFETSESAKVEYLLLSADELAQQVTLTDDELRGYYTQNKSRYATPEQRQASHVLIRLAPGASDADRKTATTKAQALLAQARSGSDFAALAKAQSQDPGSAPSGGDLGLFARDSMVKPFADAAFAMKVGDISDVVESEFGLHVIKLTAIQPGGEKPFEAVRAAIEGELKRQQAGKRFAEAAEAFTNLVYEQSDSLKPAADRFKLKILTIEALEKQASAASEKSPLNNPKLLAALFAPESIKTQRNTEALELGGNRLVSARIVEHRPAQKKPFDTVRAEVIARLTEKESRRLAREAGEARLKALQAGEPPAAGLSEPRQVVRGGKPVIAAQALEPVYRLPAEKLPAWVGVSLADGGYGVYHVLKATPPSAEQIDKQLGQYGPQLAQIAGQQDFANYLEGLKTRVKITRVETKPADKGDQPR
jgi:peptidyl-prolyl cis-trans isomerase D